MATSSLLPLYSHTFTFLDNQIILCISRVSSVLVLVNQFM